jgi:NTE family protein
MTKRAVVLGGGGTVGIAWLTGVTAGLLEAELDILGADLYVGTSAGSVAGAMLARGIDPRQVLALQAATMSANGGGGGQPQQQAAPILDPEAMEMIRSKWTTVPEMTPDLCRELGAMALKARTIPEADWLATIAGLAGNQPDWPERPLKVTAVDAVTGDFQVWDAGSGVPLPVAVASSCTVPGLFPPVSIGGCRYIDGGVRSGTNADLAAGYDAVLVIAPMAYSLFPLGQRQLSREAEALRAGGAAVALIVPDAQAQEAFGLNLMDPSRVAPAAAAGIQQGHAAADQLKAIWG